MRVSEIRVKRIRVNQGLGVLIIFFATCDSIGDYIGTIMTNSYFFACSLQGNTRNSFLSRWLSEQCFDRHAVP